MEQWIVLVMIALLAVAFTFFFPYRRIAAFFGGFYHKKAKHLILLTLNSQTEVEWRIWSYFFWSRIMGRKGNVTCIDTGSIDDTLKILYRLKKRYSRLDIVKLHPTVTLEEAIEKVVEGKQAGSKEKMVVLDLQSSEAGVKKYTA